MGARVILALTFIWMGWNKVSDPVGFLKLIRQYEIIPDGAHVFLNLTAVALPWVEIVCGVLILLGVWIRGTALTLILMLIAFTTAIATRTARIYAAGDVALCDIKFDCGCGTGVEYICAKIPENIGLLLLSALALLSRSRRFCLGGARGEKITTPPVSADSETA